MPFEDLFTSLWAALDGRALSTLHRAATSAAFLSSLLECVVFMARRVVLDGKKIREESGGKQSVLVSGESIAGDARKLVGEQFGKVWQELRDGRLKVEERASARLVVQNLDGLEKVDLGLTHGQGEDVRLRDVAWSVVSNALKNATRTNPVLVATFLKVLFDHFKEGTTAKNAVRELVYTSLDDDVQRLSGSLKTESREGVTEGVKFLECMLKQFREGLFDNQRFAQVRSPINASIYHDPGNDPCHSISMT